MNWVDYVILAVMIFYLLEGIRRGFIEQTLELFGFVLTVVVATWTYHFYAGWIVANIGIKEFVANPLSFLLAWFVYQLIYAVVLRFIYPLIPKIIRNAVPNRLAGLLPAIARGLVILAIVLTVAVALPVPDQLKSEINDSTLGSRIVKRSGSINSYLEEKFGDQWGDWLAFLTVPSQTEKVVGVDERVDLQFTTDQTSVDRASEVKMLELVNAERVKAGLVPLIEDGRLTEVARAHSKDMPLFGYFSHTNLQDQSPFDRMEMAKISFHIAGENIAKAANVDLAHAGLMRSSGHRANILQVDFRKAGIGVLDAGIYGRMFTQDFTD